MGAERAYAYMRGHKFFKMWQQEGLMNVMEYAKEVHFAAFFRPVAL